MKDGLLTVYNRPNLNLTTAQGIDTFHRAARDAQAGIVLVDSDILGDPRVRANEGGEEVNDAMLVRVVAPHFVAGLVLREGFVVEAAPILKWAIGRNRAYLSPYFERKGWEATVIKGDR